MAEKTSHMMKSWFKKSPLYIPLRNGLSKWRHLRELRDWEQGKHDLPVPHLIKQKTLVSLAQRHNINILVETGTYYGDMVEALKDKFDQIYSIELSRELHELAKRRFSHDRHVILKQGDSGHEISSILSGLDQPALFWLDAHYSAGVTSRADKDTPVLDELNHILRDRFRHIVVIDDARCFGADPAYPSIEQLREFVLAIAPDVSIAIENDGIQIVPAMA